MVPDKWKVSKSVGFARVNQSGLTWQCAPGKIGPNNLVHYRPPSQGSSPGCSSTIQSFPPPPTSYPTSMESENNDYMKAALCQIKEENQHNSA